MRALATIALVWLGACTASSQIGPYVKHIARNGDWLVVHKCIIVLDGDTLGETSCTVEQVPLRSVPSMSPPATPPPLAGPPPAPPGSAR